MAWRGGTPKIHVDFALELSDIPDLDSFKEEFSRQWEKNLRKIAVEARDFWKTQAGQKLRTSRDAYVNSITMSEVREGHYTVQLGAKGGRATKRERFLALAIETGTGPYDLKPGLLVEGKTFETRSGKKARRLYLHEGGRLGPGFATVVEGKGWIHPGFPGINLQSVVEEEIRTNLADKYAKEAFDAAKRAMNKSKKKKG